MNCMLEYAEEYEDRCPFCGYAEGTGPENASGLRPGSILRGRFIVGTAGGCGKSQIRYIGWDAMFDRIVGILEYFPSELAAREGDGCHVRATDAAPELYREGLARFYHESREMIRQYKNPDVLTCHAVFQENSTCYAVTEYTGAKTPEESCDPERTVERSEPFPEPEETGSALDSDPEMLKAAWDPVPQAPDFAAAGPAPAPPHGCAGKEAESRPSSGAVKKRQGFPKRYLVILAAAAAAAVIAAALWHSGVLSGAAAKTPAPAEAVSDMALSQDTAGEREGVREIGFRTERNVRRQFSSS